MTYSESAIGIFITYDRCLDVLEGHGFNNTTDPAGMMAFHVECWVEFGNGANVDAKHVMEWLGY
tara:strand:+ start:157 stop:348 length:192 start_codon:yes stop_codon:yes gene_type:complete